MNTTKKIVVGLGIASGALLAAWLLTGDRRKKTRKFLVKGAGAIKNHINKDNKPFNGDESCYI